MQHGTFGDPQQDTWVVDLIPWAGDRAVASLNVMSGSTSYGKVRHVLVDPGYKRMGVGANFSEERVAGLIASQWMARTRVLYDTIVDGAGAVTKVPKQPADTVPPPTEEVLKQVPGALTAWKGMRALEFKVCAVNGPRVAISPTKLAEFQNAPVSIQEEVRRLEEEHKSHEDLLSFMAIASAPPKDPEDPRGEGDAEPKPQEDLITFESEAALKTHVPDLVESTAQNDKHIAMLKDPKRGEVFLVSRQDDHIIQPLTILGGYGSGVLTNRKGTENGAVPWSLPKGDKQPVQLALNEDDDAGKKTVAKPKTGTLYMVAKPLEKKAAEAGASLSLTAFGKLMAEGTAGKHHYTFQIPEGNSKHIAMDYIIKTSSSKPSSGNFYANVASREGWHGSLDNMWRLTHDPVRHTLTARKPMVINTTKLSLKKGVPAKVLWPKKAVTRAPAADAAAAGAGGGSSDPGAATGGEGGAGGSS